MDCSRPKQPNSKNRLLRLWRQYFWTRTEFCSSTLLRKKKNQQPILHGIINAFENRYYQKTTKYDEEKMHFYQVNAPCQKSITTMVKLHELGFVLLRFSLKRLLPVRIPEKMYAGKKIVSNK